MLAFGVFVLLLPGLMLPASLGVTDAPRAAWIDPRLAGLDASPVSVIVQTAAPPDALLLAALGELGTVAYVYSVIDGVHLVLPGDRVADVARVAGVARIDRDQRVELHLDTSRPAVKVGPPLWDAGITGQGATVAVLDTGIDSQHPSVRGRVVAGVVFPSATGPPVETSTPTDADGHGTHVAAIVAGSGDGSTLLNSGDRRYAGLAVAARLVSLDMSGSFSTSTAVKAFDWVHRNREKYNITVFQNSWGREEVGQRFDPDDAVIRAQDALVRDDGVLLVFSAANKGPDPSTLSMEAMNPNVLTVAAVDDAGRIAPFSSRGPALLESGKPASWVKPDVAAPGVSIMSAAAGVRTGTGLYRELSGTSQAAPHVAGVAALVRTMAPALSPLEVMEVLRRTSHDTGAAGPDADTGFGFVDAKLAVELAAGGADGTVLVPTPEEYAESGSLVFGAPGGLSLAPDASLKTSRANGTIPVKSRAESLSFEVTLTSGTVGTSTASVKVSLYDPAGARSDIPVSGGRASRVIATPAEGPWEWRLEPASMTATGTINYHVLATVLVPLPLTISGDFGGSGGFFDESVTGRLKRTYYDAEAGYEQLAAQYGVQAPPFLYVTYAVGGLIGLLLVVRIFRR